MDHPRTSPFPGMDPYLERHWLDVHTSLVGSARSLLNQRLPPDLIARAEERIAIGDIDEDSARASRRKVAPDVLDEPATERFLEIIDIRDGERLITVIEFVSPTNKSGKGFQAFVSKREELLTSGVNFVEIDLQRKGDWRLLLQPHVCPPAVESTYRAVIRTPRDPLAAYVQPISLRAPVPSIAIPLREKDAQIELPIQTLIEEAYVSGRYGRTIDYRAACDPPLGPEDERWADDLLRAAGQR